MALVAMGGNGSGIVSVCNRGGGGGGDRSGRKRVLRSLMSVVVGGDKDSRKTEVG